MAQIWPWDSQTAREKKRKNKKYILLINLGNNQSGIEIFLIYVIPQKNFYQNVLQKCGIQTRSRRFCFYKELTATSILKRNFETS